MFSYFFSNINAIEEIMLLINKNKIFLNYILGKQSEMDSKRTEPTWHLLFIATYITLNQL